MSLAPLATGLPSTSALRVVFLSQVSFVLPDIVEQVRDAQIALRSDKDRKRPGRSNQLDGFDLQKAEKVVLN